MHGALPYGQHDKLLQERPQSLLRFFTCGSVDDGKSTLIGRILYDTNSVFEDQLETLKRDSEKFGTQGGDIDFALLLDGLSAEREQGITIDVAYRYFNTTRRAFIVADTPGHEQYTRNMATGASNSELAIILVDARKGILPQTLRHSFIVSILGIQDIVLAVNKMDLVNFDRNVFDTILKDFREATAELGFASIVSIPLSARDGDNMLTKSDRTPWYLGPTLIPHLENVQPVTAQKQSAFAMPVQWVNRPNPDFRGYTGTITSGEVKIGDEILALPGARRTRVKRIIVAGREIEHAVAGEAVTLILADEIDISRGSVLASLSHHLRPTRSLRALLLWMGDEPLDLRREYIIQTATDVASVRITDLLYRVNVENFRRQSVETLAMNQIGAASLACDKSIVIALFEQDRELGSFILIDRLNNQTVALGTIAPISPDALTKSNETAPNSVGWATPISGLSGREIAWWAAPICIVAPAVYAASGSGLAAAAVLAGDLIIRPAIGYLKRKMTKIESFEVGDTFEDGAGV